MRLLSAARSSAVRFLLVGFLLAATATVPTSAATAAPPTASAAAATAGTVDDTGDDTGDDSMLTVPSPGSEGPSDTANDFTELDRDLSECVGNSNAKPGCGRAPTHSGDRGSAMQWAIFGLMACGIAFIGWRIVAGIRRTRPV